MVYEQSTTDHHKMWMQFHICVNNCFQNDNIHTWRTMSWWRLICPASLCILPLGSHYRQSGPVSYSTIRSSGRFIVFGEALVTRIRKDCDGRTSITPWAPNITWRVPSNILGSKVLIPEAVIVKNRNVCCAVWVLFVVRYELGVRWLYRCYVVWKEALRYVIFIYKYADVVAWLKELIQDVSASKQVWVWLRIVSVEWRSMKMALRCISNAWLETMPNHTQMQKSLRRTWRTISSVLWRGSWISVQWWGVFLPLIRLISCEGRSVGLTRLVAATESKRHVAMRMDAVLTSSLRQSFFVGSGSYGNFSRVHRTWMVFVVAYHCRWCST